MYRLLLIDADGLLHAGESNPQTPTALSRPAEVLGPWDDVRIVLHSTAKPDSASLASPDWSRLSELAPRIVGSTYGLLHKAAIEVPLRFNKRWVDHHLVVIANSTVLFCRKATSTSSSATRSWDFPRQKRKRSWFHGFGKPRPPAAPPSGPGCPKATENAFSISTSTGCFTTRTCTITPGVAPTWPHRAPRCSSTLVCSASCCNRIPTCESSSLLRRFAKTAVLGQRNGCR